MTDPTPRDIACIELVEMLTDYLEGVLTPDEVAAVEIHLDGCEACARYLAQMRVTLRALGSIPVETLPAEAIDALLGAFAHPDRSLG